MRSGLLVIAAAASLSAGWCLATAGQATAGPVQYGKAPAQVSGLQLESGLLPARAFGPDFSVENAISTGRRLQSTRVTRPVGPQSCDYFMSGWDVTGLGNTAGIIEEADNANWQPSWPFSTQTVEQVVLQFARAGSAASYFSQLRSKYAACTSFTGPNPGDTVPGGGEIDGQLVSLTATTVAGHPAFGVVQTLAYSDVPGVTYYVDVLEAMDGVDVYQIWLLSGTDTQSPLMAELISRIQAVQSRR